MNEEVELPTIRININRVSFGSPNPTNGQALYDLGSISRQQKLYREVKGDAEDQPILRDDSLVHLMPDENFYSQDVTVIFVNGDEHEFGEQKITYAQVVEFFLGGGGQFSNEYLVKYSHGPGDSPSGTLAPGQKVRIANDMRFRVAGTGES